MDIHCCCGDLVQKFAKILMSREQRFNKRLLIMSPLFYAAGVSAPAFTSWSGRLFIVLSRSLDQEDRNTSSVSATDVDYSSKPRVRPHFLEDMYIMPLVLLS